MEGKIRRRQVGISMNPSPQELRIVQAMIWTIMFFLWNFGVFTALGIAGREPKWITVVGIDVLVAIVFLTFYWIL